MVECPFPGASNAVPDDPEDEDRVRRGVRSGARSGTTGISIAAAEMKPGRREYVFRFRTVFPGLYAAPPATAFSMYEPSRRGGSDALSCCGSPRGSRQSAVGTTADEFDRPARPRRARPASSSE